MRSRDRVIENLETVYRRSYDQAKVEGLQRRMEELDAAFVRDQLMMEVLLDIRDLLAQTPAQAAGPGAIEKLEALRRLTKLR